MAQHVNCMGECVYVLTCSAVINSVIPWTVAHQAPLFIVVNVY